MERETMRTVRLLSAGLVLAGVVSANAQLGTNAEITVSANISAFGSEQRNGAYGVGIAGNGDFVATWTAPPRMPTRFSCAG
jgi:hypothetical protein